MQNQLPERDRTDSRARPAVNGRSARIIAEKLVIRNALTQIILPAAGSID